MKVFTNGISITTAERKCLLHLVEDPELWLQGALTEKGRLRREALVKEQTPALMRDPSVRTLPANAKAIAAVVTGRPSYKTRAQNDAAENLPESTHHRDKFSARPVRGESVVINAAGLDLDDGDADAMLAYVQNLEEWVTGALAGMINRGRKLMIREYMPILLADNSVAEIPADEDDLVDLITARADYITKVSRG